ncbi:hypothetical protein Tdes44962_MAKER02308 [Teratosphaeria destructans]|uniref:Uncharacterized protein n=1 Tax=Teratosphaeria destructans TaxID=418781 RepID=A0A9W7W3M8_9PEZI|nr:hypothetical protein Tdes44962_MAKER02308 [Teratosphaeria destructans]
MPVIQKITGTLDTVLSTSLSSSMGTATRQESRTSHGSTSQLKRGRISRRVEIDQSEAYEKAPGVENGSVITSLIEKAVFADTSEDWKRSPMPP